MLNTIIFAAIAAVAVTASIAVSYAVGVCKGVSKGIRQEREQAAAISKMRQHASAFDDNALAFLLMASILGSRFDTPAKPEPPSKSPWPELNNFPHVVKRQADSIVYY